MNKMIHRITSIGLALTLALGIFSSGRAESKPAALLSGDIVNLAYFYKPPNNSDAITVAHTYNTVILTGGDESFRNQLTSNGFATTVIQYYGALGIQDPGDCSSTPRHNQVAYNAGDFCSISQNHPDWFLLDTNGQRVKASPTSDIYRMDPGNAGWRAFFVQRVLDYQAQSGWSGLFLDNVEASLSDMQSDGCSLAQYPDDASYHAAVKGFLQYLHDNYSQPYNRPLFGNIISRKDEASWLDYMQVLDGAMQERWSVAWSLDQYVTESKWTSDLALAEKTQNLGKYIIAVAPGSQGDTNRQNFAFASFLLISNGKAAFRYSGAKTYDQVWTYSNFQVNLGKPLGARYQSGGLWRRDFANGSVTVDPVNHTATISLGSSAPTAIAAPPTNTPVPPTATTPPTSTPTNTPIPLTATPTALSSATSTWVPPTPTKVPATITRTNTPPAVRNRVLNPGFEMAGSNAADAVNWTEGRNHTRANDKFHTGGWALHSTFRGVGTDTHTTVPITVSPNTTYTYSGYIWRTNSTGGACLDMNDIVGEKQLCAGANGSWQYLNGTWNSGSNTNVTLRLITDGSPTGDIWFDDISLVGPG